jgi:hypothetical protein
MKQFHFEEFDTLKDKVIKISKTAYFYFRENIRHNPCNNSEVSYCYDI